MTKLALLETMPLRILALGETDRLARAARLAEREGHEIATSDGIAGDQAASTEPPELVVIDGEGADALTLGRQALAAFPKASLLFVATSGHLERIRSALPFAPGLGGAWTADGDAGDPALSSVIAEAGMAGRVRAGAATVMDGINRRLVQRAAEESRRRADQERLSESYFRTLIANASDAFLAIAADGRILALNEAGMRMFGVDEDLPDMRLADALDASARDTLAGLLSRVAKGDHVRLATLPLARQDGGEPRHAEFSFAPVLDADGDVESISATARDITERIRVATELERSERALRESEANLRLLLDSTGEGFYAIDTDGKATLCNPAFLRLIGLSDPSEVIGRKVHDIVHHSHPDGSPYAEADCPIYRCVRDGTAAHVSDEYFYRLDGRAVPVEYRAHPIVSEGRIRGAICTCVDITERKQAEAALRELNETLELRVADAILEREAAEEQLRQAQKMEAVGQLTGGIAHDFNNLLTVITGNMDMARRSIESGNHGRVERAVANALKGAERAAVLTQRLLAFSRRQPLDPKPTHVGRLICDMSDMLARTLGERIQIETVVGAGLWKVEIDPHQLESAILNLALNARDAMPGDGKLTIEVSNTHIDESYAGVHAEVAAGQYVVVCVTDTGTGMSKETIERAFDPFFTTKEVGKGTGLGLSMVYGFVKQSGGHVKIYSEVGEGTTIKLYLPRIAGAAEAEPTVALEPVFRGTDAETILVVEDDDEVRGFTVESLRELGYRVIEAADGPSALRWLKQHREPVQLILTDVVMPAMSGRELADAARAEQSGLKVLFMTGYARNAIVHGGRLDPGVDLLSKPFTYDALGRKVREMLDRD